MSLETSLQIMEETGCGGGTSIVDVYNGTGVDRIVEICRGRAIPSHLRGKVCVFIIKNVKRNLIGYFRLVKVPC